MTAPAPGLATIREELEGDELEQNVADAAEKKAATRGGKAPVAGPLDSLDTELFVKPTKSSVKQMRVPKLNNKPTAAGRVGEESNTPWSKSGSAGNLSDRGVANLFAQRKDSKIFQDTPLLGTLDDALLASLEQIITLIMEACLDSRNFDLWETRQTCIDVNDSIVCFLRDLFSFLNPSAVHQLLMVYFA